MKETQLVPREDYSIVPSPAEVVEIATVQAKLLMDIVEKTGCYQEISGKKYLQVEAWETIGAFNRTHAETESTNPIIKDNEVIGYQARVQLWKDGVVVGGAIMPCYFTENCCKGKEGDAKHKASMSAAQTFATSKAYRMNYSYIAILAGYEPTPAEEMIGGAIVNGDRKATDPGTWLKVCPDHNTKWYEGKFGLNHKTEDGWCKASVVFGKYFGQQCELFGWTKESNTLEINDWLKDNFGATWSKMSDQQRLQAIEMMRGKATERPVHGSLVDEALEMGAEIVEGRDE